MKQHRVCHLKKVQYCGISTALTVAFLIAIILCNALVGVAAAKLPLTLDLTHNKAFALSQETAAYLSQQDAPVAITVLADALSLENNGGYYAQAKSILDQYPKYGKKLSLTYVDPVRNPSFVAQYPELSLAQYDILVSCNEKHIKLSLSELFNVGFRQNGGQQFIESSRAEQEITSAILRATAKKDTKVMLLTGHDEVYGEELKQLLGKNGYQVSELNLLTDSLDACVDAAFLLAPQRDLDLAMIEKLDAYLANDGAHGRQLFYAPHPTAPTLPTLEAFLAQWGIQVGTNIVMEQNPQRYANGLSYLCLVTPATSESADDTVFLSPLGRELAVTFAQQTSYATNVLLSYSAQAYTVSSDTPQGWQPEKEDLGAHPALIASTHASYTGLAVQESCIFAFSSAAAFDDTALQSQSVDNAQYVSQLLAQITDHSRPVSITPKSLQSAQLGMTQAQFLWYSGLFVVALPLAIFLTGAIVWLRRRNR